MREFFTEGEYRYCEAIILCIIFGIIFYFFHGEHVLNALSEFFKAATYILTSMGLVAYNLRNKVVENIMKMMENRADFQELGNKAIQCGQHLTDIVILSIISLACTFVVSTLPKDHHAILYIAFSIAAVLFIFCCILYIHILLTFDRLEKGIIDDKKKKREENIRQQRREELEEDKDKYPDN